MLLICDHRLPSAYASSNATQRSCSTTLACFDLNQNENNKRKKGVKTEGWVGLGEARRKEKKVSVYTPGTDNPHISIKQNK